MRAVHDRALRLTMDALTDERELPATGRDRQPAAAQRASPVVLAGHLDGLAAIVEPHFRFAERALLDILQRLDLSASTEDAFGPL